MNACRALADAPRRSIGALAVATAMMLVAPAARGAPAAPVPPSSATGRPIDGIACERMEGTAFHIHAHLAIFDHGRPVMIPSDVGRPLLPGCLYWLHTHTPDGTIHIESPVVRTFTLGQFFDIWGEPLTPTRVASAQVAAPGQIHVWVDGRPYAGDPRRIPFYEHTQIVIEAGPPYHPPQPFTDWGGL